MVICNRVLNLMYFSICRPLPRLHRNPRSPSPWRSARPASVENAKHDSLIMVVNKKILVNHHLSDFVIWKQGSTIIFKTLSKPIYLIFQLCVNLYVKVVFLLRIHWVHYTVGNTAGEMIQFTKRIWCSNMVQRLIISPITGLL